MAELPEEEVAPTATCNEVNDTTTTPVHISESSSRRSSFVWSTLRSKSRIFGSKKRDSTSTPLSVSTMGYLARKSVIVPQPRFLSAQWVGFYYDDHIAQSASFTILEPAADEEGGVTPSGRPLRRCSASSSSVHKRVSSALKKGFGCEFGFWRNFRYYSTLVDPKNEHREFC
ncbi:unnamed protein product [Cylicostephanus goldi]|uniref:Uncharacterized protein n=1 Tax=Cylicostephanus goldi TaxID=71465 RepID=A0A3P7R7L5_CYLGO|nr:unnamed protein product [Cylicostephanus goldi]